MNYSKKQISRAKKDQQEFNRHSKRGIQKHGNDPAKIQRISQSSNASKGRTETERNGPK